MKQIKSLNILGMKVKVVYVDLSAENICGKYNYKERKIYIDKKLDKETMQVTLFHEFLHATFYRAGLPNAKISDDAEEIMVDQFSKALVENFHFRPK